MQFSVNRFAFAGLLFSVVPLSTWACATCGCSLSSDAAMGYSTSEGFRVNLEYAYIHQDELRSGTQSTTGVPDDNELEHDTLNRYFTLGLGYNPNADWNVDLRLPYIVRTHSTYGDFNSSQPLPDLSNSHSSTLGDIKLVASYQGLLPTHNFGLQLGVKLPTGSYGSTINFYNGPDAGEPLDASLQPGTGSTDVIVGAYYYQAISQNFDVITNAQFQSVVKSKQDESGNDYRPGNAANISIGLRYEANPNWVPQLQLNVTHKNADQGALADTTSTAGTALYLSPGVTVKALAKLHVYGFVQVPVYSNLDGYQLFPHWTANVGASYAF